VKKSLSKKIKIIFVLQVIPPDLQHPPRRLSKIKTLQSAIKYIKKLQEMLEN
jgi:hypothetical protein